MIFYSRKPVSSEQKELHDSLILAKYHFHFNWIFSEIRFDWQHYAIKSKKN